MYLTTVSSFSHNKHFIDVEVAYRVPEALIKMVETGVYLNGNGSDPEDHRKLKIKKKKR